MRPQLAILAALALVAAPAAAQHHEGEAHDAHHGDAPASVVAFHDLLAPDWHSEAGPERREVACGRLQSYREHGSAVAAEPAPHGVDAAAWSSATAALARAVDGLGGACEGAGDFDATFSELHDRFHGVVELIE